MCETETCLKHHTSKTRQDVFYQNKLINRLWNCLGTAELWNGGCAMFTIVWHTHKITKIEILFISVLANYLFRNFWQNELEISTRSQLVKQHVKNLQHERASIDRRISQISQCTSLISHNASHVHISVPKWVLWPGCGTSVFWDLWSISLLANTFCAAQN